MIERFVGEHTDAVVLGIFLLAGAMAALFAWQYRKAGRS